MANKTEGIKILVQEVLQTISEPYGEDIIFEVCLKPCFCANTADFYSITQTEGISNR
jgi:hypothetical protein